MLNNPLIRRYRYSLMRPRQLWIYITIYVAIIALLLFLNYIAYTPQRTFHNPTYFFRSVSYQLFTLQALVLCLLAAANSGSAIREEVTGKSYDFFRMLPISASKKAVGILVGKNLVVLLLAAANFLLLIIFAILGQVAASLFVQSLLAIMSVALLTNSVALLSSIKPVSKKRTSSIATLIILAFLLGPLVIRGLVAIWGIDQIENITMKFYTIEVPIIILVSLVALYFSCWSITGVLRKFTREDEPLFSRTGAYLFMAGYELVLLGLFYAPLTEATKIPNWILNYCYWLISLVPVLTVPLWSLRNFDKYLEHSGLIRSNSTKSKGMILRMLLYSNLSLDFGLFAIWAAGAIGTTLITGLELLPHLYIILILFSFYLFLMLLLEISVVFTPLSDKVGLLLGFFAAVYVILPIILYGILESKTLYLHSPVGFLFGMFQKSHGEIAIQNSIWVINLTLCVIPIVLISKRQLHILRTRQKM